MGQPSSHYIFTLRHRGHELGTWKLASTGLRIGRTAENHIVIDCLSVSRLHATIELSGDGAVIRDCRSFNGIVVNGERVERSTLSHGDVVTIGRHELVCRVAGPDGNVAADPGLFETSLRAAAHDLSGPIPNPGLLTEASPDRERSHVLDHGLMIIGSDDAADVVVQGRGIAPYHAEIRYLNGRYSLRHLDGRARVRVDGQVVKEYMLVDGCRIEIGDFAFVFAAHANATAQPR
jgi:pSer/pThr/pTyr-binding forkhead associated (FHA) protein